jgi:hypothetical protein
MGTIMEEKSIEFLGTFNRGVSAIKEALVDALSDAGVKSPSIAVIAKNGPERAPDSISIQVSAGGRSVTEAFTQNEVLDSVTAVDGMAIASRIRGIAATLARRSQRQQRAKLT